MQSFNEFLFFIFFRQISSVSPPNHYRSEDKLTTESYSVYHQLLTQSVTNHQSLRNSPPQFAHSDLHAHDAPLNLSLTNSSANNDSSPQSRPSVITCAPLTTNGRFENGSTGSVSPASRREVNSGLYTLPVDSKV